MPTTDESHVTEIHRDVAVVGAGIAGLWCARLANERGLSSVVLAPSIGGEQTLAAQGIIHSGAKYAQPRETSTMARMPARWRTLLSGQGDIDLTSVRIISPQMTAISRSDRTKDFAEPVIDTPSLVSTLAAPLDCITATITLNAIERGSVGIEALRTASNRVRAGHYFFCAGTGNAALSAGLDADLPTVSRPLRQLIARCRTPIEPIFCHVFDGGDEPAVTATTHQLNGATYLYFGGRVATRAHRTDDERRAEIARLLPAINIDELDWGSIERDRAELTIDGHRELDVQAATVGNVTFCWPTKLCLVPRLEEKLRSIWPTVRTTPRGEIPASLRPSVAGSPIVGAFDPTAAAR